MNRNLRVIAPLAFFVAAFLLAAPTRAGAGTLEVRVEGVTFVEGQMLIGIFDCAEDFRTNPLQFSPVVAITEVGTVVAKIEGLAPGRYALAVIWDLNMNGELDTNGLFKIPKEPFGFSNNPKALLGPPSFEECIFELTEAGEVVEIVLQRR